jgi:Fibrobacter succinogenes major domain (Fib_succ_major).
MIKKKLKLMLLSVLPVLALASCSWEDTMDGPGLRGDQVLFSVSVPANHTLTRAFADAEPEYEVKTLDVLLFDTSTGKLLSRATNSGTPVISGRNLDFYVKLEKDASVTNYDFVLLANVRDLITSNLYTNGKLQTGLTKQQVQGVLRESLTAGTGWITNTANGSYKAMPMWGELENQTIEAGKTYTRTTMLRATVKIDLEVNLGTSTNTFELEEVWYYNYNTEGYVIPFSGNLENGKAKNPTISGLTLNTADPIDYSSAISTDKQSLKSAIYCFEGPEGSLSDLDNNPLLLIKGSFNGTPGWYRFDFANIDGDTFAATYMPLLRNHWYKMQITAVNGPGYENPGEALDSKPGNLGTNITIWDGENVLGSWNGNYEIKFNTLDAHFTQFATPTPQVIKITTNVPELTFENFTNITKGSGDGDWAESPAGTWSNGHFTVVIAKGATVDEFTEYTLTITTKATTGEATDPARDTRFKVKGKNMEANIKITQDAHVVYRLVTTPDPLTTPLTIDGAKQRIKIEVESTHNYDILLNQSSVTMFTGVWDAQTGGNQITTLTDIGKDRKAIWVEADIYGGVDPRVGTFVIQHNDGQSDASPKRFNVLQVTPAIEAVLAEGGYAAEIAKAGGEKTIRVTSNMNAWTAQVSLKVGDGADNALTGTALTGLFDNAGGSGNATVKFILGALADSETSDRVYTITFKDANGTTESTPPIVITQKAKLPGSGGGGIPPTGGVRAEEFILSVNSKGQLNLDGEYDDGTENWIVYFKWGSLIATAGGVNKDVFNKDKVAWTPEGYDYDALMTSIGTTTGSTAMFMIPYVGDANNPDATYFTNGEINPAKTNPAKGAGDPCTLAVKDGVVGGYKMPTGNPYNGYTEMGAWKNSKNAVRGSTGRYNTAGDQFYPAAGYRPTGNDHVFLNVGTNGYYWSSTHINAGSTYGYTLSFFNTEFYLTQHYSRQYAMAVRCVRDTTTP